MSRCTYRFAVALLAAGTMVCASAGLAAAHVTVNPDKAQQGSYAELSFQVPTERDDASTTGFEVVFPADHPIRSVSIRPHPGWTYRVTTTTFDPPKTIEGKPVTEVVSRITWTASGKGNAIRPGEYDAFSVSAGPMPAADHLEFKALQRYSDSKVVRWIQHTEPGAPEPENPAPALTLVPAAADRAPSPASAKGSDHASTGGTTDGWTLGTAAALIVAVGAAALTWRDRARRRAGGDRRSAIG